MPRVGDSVYIIAGMHGGLNGYIKSADRYNSTYGVIIAGSGEEVFVSDWMLGDRSSPPFKINDEVIILPHGQRGKVSYVGKRSNGEPVYRVKEHNSAFNGWHDDDELQLAPIPVVIDDEDEPIVYRHAAAAAASSSSAAAAVPPAGRPVMMVDQPPAAAAAGPVTPADIARYCDYKRTTRGSTDLSIGMIDMGDNACPHCMAAAGGRLVYSKTYKFYACKRCERKWDSNRHFPSQHKSIEEAVRAHPISAVSAPESGKTLTDGAPPAYSDVFTAQGTPKVGKKRKVGDDETASSSSAAAAQ